MSKVKFKAELDEVCMLMARICVHASEDCPSEYRTHHFREALDDAVDYLKESGWYEHHKKRGARANE
jgi:hypothetical protein